MRVTETGRLWAVQQDGLAGSATRDQAAVRCITIWLSQRDGTLLPVRMSVTSPLDLEGEVWRTVSRDRLEHHQVWLYLVAVGLGLALGAIWRNAGALDVLLWPALGLLLFVTFTQVPLLHVSAAF